MLLEHLSLVNFKNYQTREFEFVEGINCLTGPNGSGKTNVLEAIYYLSYCKGYFNPQDSQNIKHGEEFFMIDSKFLKDGDRSRVQCAVKRGQKKKFKKDNKEYQRLIDHIGRYPVVIISPYDSDLINEGSDVRRKFIDSIISQNDRNYLETLVQYNRTLEQRNNLLRYFWENRVRDDDQLSVWDAQLVEFGTVIHRKRKAFVDEFAPEFVSLYGRISGDKEEVDVRYRSQLHDQDFLSLLKEGVQKDMSRSYTLTGVHKDDFLFSIGGHPVKKFGSQGQQKSFLIALKLAQFQYMKENSGICPLLLLDDVFDKIDDERVEHLMELVSEATFGQIFITDTNEGRLRRILGEHESHYIAIESMAQDPVYEQA